MDGNTKMVSMRHEKSNEVNVGSDKFVDVTFACDGGERKAKMPRKDRKEEVEKEELTLEAVAVIVGEEKGEKVSLGVTLVDNDGPLKITKDSSEACTSVMVLITELLTAVQDRQSKEGGIDHEVFEEKVEPLDVTGVCSGNCSLCVLLKKRKFLLDLELVPAENFNSLVGSVESMVIKIKKEVVDDKEKVKNKKELLEVLKLLEEEEKKVAENGEKRKTELLTKPIIVSEVPVGFPSVVEGVSMATNLGLRSGKDYKVECDPHLSNHGV